MVLIGLEVDRAFQGRQRVGPRAGDGAAVGRPRDIHVAHLENLDMFRRDGRTVRPHQGPRGNSHIVQRRGWPHDELRRLGLVLRRPNDNDIAFRLGQVPVPGNLPT